MDFLTVLLIAFVCVYRLGLFRGERHEKKRLDARLARTMKRSWLKLRSPQRDQENAKRARLMFEKFGPWAEWRCQFSSHEIDYISSTRCRGPVHGHELLKRSRGGSITDMDNVVLLCQFHNGWVEDHPKEG